MAFLAVHALILAGPAYAANLVSHPLISNAGGGSSVSYDSTTQTYTVTKQPNTNYAGVGIPYSTFVAGKTYRLTYDVQKLDGTLVRIGGHDRYNAYTIWHCYIDDFALGEPYDASYIVGRIRDDSSKLDNGGVHHVDLLFTVHKTDLNNDLSFYIQPNRERTEGVTTKISNISIEEVSALQEVNFGQLQPANSSITWSYNSSTGIYELTENQDMTGLYIPESYIPKGYEYFLQYKIKKTSGSITSIGGHHVNADTTLFLVDMDPSPRTYQSASGDASLNNIADDTAEHTVKHFFVQNDVAGGSSGLGLYIQPNRGTTSSTKTCTVQIYDVHLYKVRSEARVTHWLYGFRNSEGNHYGTSNAGSAFYLGSSRSAFNSYGSSISFSASSVAGASPSVATPNGTRLSNMSASWISGGTASFPVAKTQPALTNLLGEYNYEPIDYSISYNVGEGTNSPSNPSTYNVLYGVAFTDPQPPVGYSFSHWSDDSSNTSVTGVNVGANASFESPSQLYSSLSSRRTGNVSVSAHYSPNTYKLVFDANDEDAEGAQSDESAVYDTALSAPYCTYSKEGYSFKYWTESESDPGSGYEAGDDILNLTAEDGGEVTLYAQWRFAAEVSGIEPLNPDEDGNGYGDNLAFSAPSDISAVIKPGGDLMFPSNSYVQNLSAYRIEISGIENESQGEWVLMSSIPAGTSTKNALCASLKIGDGAFANLTDYSTKTTITGQAMTPMSTKSLAWAGNAANIIDEAGGDFATVTWYVRPAYD